MCPLSMREVPSLPSCCQPPAPTCAGGHPLQWRARWLLVGGGASRGPMRRSPSCSTSFRPAAMSSGNLASCPTHARLLSPYLLPLRSTCSSNSTRARSCGSGSTAEGRAARGWARACGATGVRCRLPSPCDGQISLAGRQGCRAG